MKLYPYDKKCKLRITASDTQKFPVLGAYIWMRRMITLNNRFGAIVVFGTNTNVWAQLRRSRQPNNSMTPQKITPRWLGPCRAHVPPEHAMTMTMTMRVCTCVRSQACNFAFPTFNLLGSFWRSCGIVDASDDTSLLMFIYFLVSAHPDASAYRSALTNTLLASHHQAYSFKKPPTHPRNPRRPRCTPSHPHIHWRRCHDTRTHTACGPRCDPTWGEDTNMNWSFILDIVHSPPPH